MKKETNWEKQKKRQHKMIEKRFDCDVDSIEIVLNGLRHIYNYCDVYWTTAGHSIRPQRLKQLLISECHEPESTARSHVKAMVEGDYGLFFYDEENDVLVLDEFYVDEFLHELSYLLLGDGDWKCKMPADAYKERGWKCAEDADIYWDEFYDLGEDAETKQDLKDEKKVDQSS